MARSDHLPGVEVAITVDGNDLKEYTCDEQGSEPRTTTKYVEATSNKHFEIRVKVDKGFRFPGDAHSLAAGVDGVLVDKIKIYKADYLIWNGEKRI